MVPRRQGPILVLNLCLGWGVLADGGCSLTDQSPPVRPPPPSQPALAASAPARRLRRLSSREYDNVVRDLLGVETRPAAAGFLTDVYQNGYDNGSVGLAVQSDQVVAYQAAAEALAAGALASHRTAVLGDCDPAAIGADVCLEWVLSSFAARAYRRPLTATEAQRLRDVFHAEIGAGGDFDRGLRTVLEVILQSPQFLYREELGATDVAAVPVAGTTVDLTAYEVASEMSFLLTGSIPDAELWSAVATGRFTTAADRHAQAVRLLATPAARDTLRGFLHQWLATRRLGNISKSRDVYPAFDATLAASMAGELDRFFDDVLWNRTGSLREMFSSSRSFVDPALGSLYDAPVSGPGFQPVTLDARLRPGILTRAGFLAVHADADSSGPIARGVFVLSSIACAPPHAPPANIPPAPPVNDPSVAGRTTRQRFQQHVSSDFCAACHTQIDGIGFGFEAFDGVGAYRTSENGQPIDASGNIVGLGDDVDGPFDGAAQLAARLAGSQVLADCFARQIFRYAMGQAEGAQEDLRWLTRASAPDARMTDLMLSVVDSAAFTRRSFE